MKTKLKPAARKVSAKRAVAKVVAHAPAVVPLKSRALNFGSKWDYAPAPEDFKYIQIAPRHELFINGQFVAPHSGKYFESVNPATEQTLKEIAAADEPGRPRPVERTSRKMKPLGTFGSRRTLRRFFRVAARRPSTAGEKPAATFQTGSK